MVRTELGLAGRKEKTWMAAAAAAAVAGVGEGCPAVVGGQAGGQIAVGGTVGPGEGYPTVGVV